MEYPAGLTCEIVVARLERYLASALAWAEALGVGEHLEACEPCAHRLVLLRVEVGVGVVAPGARAEGRRPGKRGGGGRRD